MLEKINRLYESMIIDSKMDPFEQELMLSYIKKLYVAFSLEGEPMAMVSQNRHTERPTVVPETPKPKVSKRVAPERPKVVPPQPKPIAEPIQEVVQPEPSPAPVREKVASVSKTPPIDEAISLLFEDKTGKELSDKLASLPIKDLTKAMGLNERILTVNELFGKDQAAFSAAMKDMNAMRNFEEAKSYLVGCAQKYNWTAKSNKKKAQIFIKLIRRRYQ